MNIDSMKIVPVSQPKSQQSVVTGTAWQPVNLANYERCLFVISIGELATAGSASLTAIVKCYSAVSGLNASGTAITGRYKFTSAAFDVSSATNDAFDSSWSDLATTGVAITGGTHDNFTLLIEIVGAKCSADKPFVGITGSVAAAADYMSAIAILTGARFAPELGACA